MYPLSRLNLRPDVRLGRMVSTSLAVTICLAACGSSPASPTPTNVAPSPSGSAGPSGTGPTIPVVGTENFYADLLAEIGGSRVSATSLLNDPNADPHEFESSPQDAELVADARVVIVSGVGYDDFMQQLLLGSNQPDRVVIDVQDLLGLADDVNPHVWYDPATMPRVADAATSALSQLDPQDAAYFASREQTYLASLAPIAAKVAALKAAYAGTPIAFTEDVAGYLTDKIGLVVKSPVGFMKAVEEGTDPPPADVATERDLFTGKLVKVLLYNSQVTSPTTVSIHDLAALNGIPIVGVAETIPAGFDTYAAWQLAQLTGLEQALKSGG